MKKLLCILLILCLLIPTTGCTSNRKDVYFYYPRKEVVSGGDDGVIAKEEREIPRSENDLKNLLTLYLEGPLSQNLKNPFPHGTKLLHVALQGNTVVLTFTEPFQKLEGIDRTIACASIVQTCLGLVSFQEIHFISGNKLISLTPNTIALADNSTADPT